MVEQAKWDEHAAFMNGLAKEGFVVLGGPIGYGPKILVIIDAESEDAINARLRSTGRTEANPPVCRSAPW